ISANNGNGVDLGDNTTVLSNFIGTDASGTANLGNAFDGVFIVGSNNVIGLPGQGNVIAYNGALGPQFGSGVDIGSFVGIDNAIRGNSILVPMESRRTPIILPTTRARTICRTIRCSHRRQLLRAAPRLTARCRPVP